MRIRPAFCALLLAILLPNLAFAAQGVLLLADEGTPEWKSQLMQLGAAVDKQKPTEVVFWPAAHPEMQVAVDRLIQRGVSEIVAVPLFVAMPPSDLSSLLKSSVPLRMAAGMGSDPLVSEILLGRALAISTNPPDEALVLVSHRAPAGSDKRWVPDIGLASQLLNRPRQFKTIIASRFTPGSDAAAATDTALVRLLVERELTASRRVIVVPVSTPYGNAEAAIREQLQGLTYEMAKSGLMPDDRLVAWIVARAGTAAAASR